MSCTVTDGVADVRLNRPDKLNALDQPMFEQLVATGERLRRDSSVRAVVLSGEGRAFCAGLDFSIFGELAEGSRPARMETDGPAKALGQQAAHIWTLLPQPVIAAVHGVAYGGGLQVALGADIRLVSSDAQLSVMEIKWGINPDMTGTQVLPELVGRDIAKELTFTGRVVGGEEAVALRLATRVEGDPHAAALALAGEIASKSPEAVRESKRLLDLAGRVSLAEGFEAEQVAIHSLIGTPNQHEAIAANLEKRPPKFTDPAQ
ncbi:crotonase/enoyl-CoA hydratase family protein [Saccharopolyspora rhizosphaerae]|uniref:Crotonase/enoyl-CoA hydratase family protein n=1 Tax=Saccharopolyspora rhizosphaerae TaxID=2492662 RepID=A0A3R8P5N1_9PSEU|nr:crotonase/enoyl-CoA hydratase family protein [Saccharopolyspora rhizosphaerae]